MSKILKTLTVSLLLAIIMIATVAGAVFADDRDRDQERDPTSEFCDPNPDEYQYQKRGQP